MYNASKHGYAKDFDETLYLYFFTEVGKTVESVQ